jgi:crotonobetainyl-CoA:carnitine CoA-transferase CaiB-like acyl-CoA transferase
MILEGIRVLDISNLLAGPYCAMILGEMGAEVIKIEHPQGGDPARIMGPPFCQGQSALALSVNRNKKSLTLDLSKEKGREIFLHLLKNAQVVVENFRPDMVEEMGLDFSSLNRGRPDLIYCSITGFGERGPYRDKAGTDTIFQGMGGVMTVSGEPGDPPLRLGFPLADVVTGVYAALGVMGALYHRASTGKGQKVEVNLLDSLIALQTPRVMEYFITGENPPRTGRSSPFGAPIQFFETKEGYINLSVFVGKFWRKLCKALNREDLAEDPRFTTNPDRMKNRKELEKILGGIFLRKTAKEWQRILEAHDVPSGPVYTYQEMFRDPQVQQNQIAVELDHKILGPMRYVGLPFHLLSAPPRKRTAPPMAGEHTVKILKEEGFSPAEIEELKKQRIV